VALIHQGQIHQTGSPAELRASLGAKRLELRMPRLAEAETLLAKNAGANKEVVDVQRFGDRLDLLVRNPEEAEEMIVRQLRSAQLGSPEFHVDEPTLENTFVARLRGLGSELGAEVFPSRHPHTDLRGEVGIGAKALTKQFGTFTAVKNVSVQVRYGEVYGLLGANGAGKTTTIKMLCGLLAPTAGEMELAGERGSLRSPKVRQHIGYMSQKFSLYDDLSIRENLDFFAGVYGVPEDEREEKRGWTLSFSGLEGKESQITGSLPGGWKQRVALGAAIMHEPSVLFLDEPTSGVDPLARRAFWRVINRLADLGSAILVTTHYLEEAEQCNRLGFMVAGELVAEGTPSEIKSRQKGHLLEFIVDQPQRAADLLKKRLERWRVSLFGDRLHVIREDDADTGIRRTTEELAGENIRVQSAREGRFSLEDIFITVVEKARRQGKVAVED